MKVKYPMADATIFFMFNYGDYKEVIHWIAQHQKIYTEDYLRSQYEKFWHNVEPALAWLDFYVASDVEVREAMVQYITDVYAPRSREYEPEELEKIQND